MLERLARVHALGARLQTQERRDRLEVVLHAMMDLLREHTTHDGASVLERDGRVMRDRLEERAVVVGERRVAIGDELADLAAPPAQRRAHRVGARTSFRPRDAPVLEHERRSRRRHGVHGGLHDRLERLLEVERLRHGLGDPCERLQLGNPTLGLRVELCVHDRLRDLIRDRLDELDLGRVVLPRGAE